VPAVKILARSGTGRRQPRPQRAPTWSTCETWHNLTQKVPALGMARTIVELASRYREAEEQEKRLLALEEAAAVQRSPAAP